MTDLQIICKCKVSTTSEALANRLQYRTVCKIQNGRQLSIDTSTPSMREKVVTEKKENMETMGEKKIILF